MAFSSPSMADRVRNAVTARRDVQLTTDWLHCHLSNYCRSPVGIEGGTDEVAFWHQCLVACGTQEEVRAQSMLTALQRSLWTIASYSNSRRPVAHFRASPSSARCDRSSASESS